MGKGHGWDEGGGSGAQGTQLPALASEQLLERWGPGQG